MNEDSAQLEAWRWFAKVHSVVVRALEHEMDQEHELPLSFCDVLTRLEQASEGRLRMGALAESLAYSPSGLTRLLDRMEESGLVERRPVSGDRRGWAAIITPKGRVFLERARPVYRRAIDSHFLRHVDDADMQALRKVLSKVLEGEAPAGNAEERSLPSS